MEPVDYRRNVEELEEVASLFWPKEISEQEIELSIIPKLIETQDQFLKILSIEVTDIENLFQIVNASMLSANLFLKHLCILADFGGESFKRISSQHKKFFINKQLTYYWSLDNTAQERVYKFKSFPDKKLSNDTLNISGKNLLKDSLLSDLQKDAIAILLFGGSSTAAEMKDDDKVFLEKCVISDYLGQTDELKDFVHQRYIWVSKITSGSKANTYGQLVQQFVHSYLEKNLTIDSVTYRSNGHIPGIRHVGKNDVRLTTFDLVIEHKNHYVAIEISFQQTTNSVIERKSGQAKTRYEQIDEAGFKLAYIIDGAGNFERKSALQTICDHSHCTVAFSHSELQILCQFVSEYFEGIL